MDLPPTDQGSPAFAPPPAPRRWSRRRWAVVLVGLAVFVALAVLLSIGLSRVPG